MPSGGRGGSPRLGGAAGLGPGPPLPAGVPDAPVHVRRRATSGFPRHAAPNRTRIHIHHQRHTGRSSGRCVRRPPAWSTRRGHPPP
ncbi:hypothetical protein DSY14_25040, partial [Nocardiopsis sp. MG754419]|nr:hypothetical protein [Nocardiopsis sp. MG754419]